MTSRSLSTEPDFAREVVGLGDFDGDGLTEFAVLDALGRSFSVWSLGGADASRRLTNLGVPTEIRAFAAGADLTGDGRTDLALSFGGQVRVFPGGGGNALDIVPTVAHASFADVMIAGGDGDGDGVSELVVRHGMANALQVYRYVSGGFVREVRVDGAATDSARLLAPGDMDGVRPDELVVLDTVGQVRVRRGGTDTDLTAAYPWSAPAGVLLAGTSSAAVRGRIWYARGRNFSQHGIEILSLGTNGFSALRADALYSTAVRLVAR